MQRTCNGHVPAYMRIPHIDAQGQLLYAVHLSAFASQSISLAEDATTHCNVLANRQQQQREVLNGQTPATAEAAQTAESADAHSRCSSSCRMLVQIAYSRVKDELRHLTRNMT